jgi:hypothetical protein
MPALFLHIQKTAGSALLDSIWPHYGASMITHGDFIGRRPADFKDVMFVSGHFGYAYAKSLMPSRYSFTLLRDPVERVLSYYHYCRSQNTDKFSTYTLAKELDLVPFLIAVSEDVLIRKSVWNNQAWQLARGFGYVYTPESRDPVTGELQLDDSSPEEILSLAISHLDEFSYVGFAETFAADRDVICSKLGLPPDSDGALTISSPPRPRAPDLPDSTLQLLRDLTQLDQILYDTAMRKREAAAE